MEYVQIPKFDAKPNPNPMPIRFGQMTLRTSELSPAFAVDSKQIHVYYE